MDDYPGAEPIPGPLLSIDSQYEELLYFLRDNQDMRKTARNSLKHGLWAGGGAVTGGLLLLGGMMGGIAGSIYGYFQADEYDGVLTKILNLPEGSIEKEQLVQGVRTILQSAGASATQFDSTEAFRNALVTFAGQPGVKEELWKACVAAVQSTG